MFKEDTLFLLIKNWWKYTPEDELYYKLEENPYWPFKQIADGYYYVVVQSDRAAYGMWFFIASIIGHILCTYLLGYFALTQTFFIISYFFCGWTLRGRIAWRELIISRVYQTNYLRGKGSYMIRVMSNQEKLIQHDLRNVYIRLTRKDDTSGDPYFWLNLSGYELDDYRITRMTKAENALRIMGMRLACRLGVNFFDWKDESVRNKQLKLPEDHLIFHYKTYTKLVFQAQPLAVGGKSKDKDLLDDGDKGKSEDNQHHHHQHHRHSHKGKTHLSVPTRRGHTSGSDSGASSPKYRRSATDVSMYDAKRKVKNENKIGIKKT